MQRTWVDLFWDSGSWGLGRRRRRLYWEECPGLLDLRRRVRILLVDLIRGVFPVESLDYRLCGIRDGESEGGHGIRLGD
jgi:hypothetical protein